MILKTSLFERLLHRFHLLPTPIMDAFGGVVFGRALAIAVRRGMFDILGQSPRGAKELAASIKLSEPGTELLLRSFVATGYLSLDHDQYRLTPEARKWLSKDSPHYLGNLVRYFETLYARWGYLEHSLEHGIPPQRYFDAFTNEDWKVYVYGMRDLARMLSKEVINKIVLLNSPQSLLDLGGSHGLFAIECCRHYPSLKAAVVDFANALQHTQVIVDEEGMQGRVQLHPGDFTKMELPQFQDCALMFNVIHGLREEENKTLIQHVLDALKGGGKLYILDQLREEKQRTGLAQFMPLMVGLNLLNEIGGNTYSFAQVQSWCTGAAKVSRMRLRFPGVSLVEVIR